MKKGTLIISVIAIAIAIYGYAENRKYHKAVVVLQKEHIKLNKIIKKFLEVPTPEHEYLENGTAAPNFNLENTKGEYIEPDFSTKPNTLLVFSARGCSHCDEFYPSLDSFAKKYPEKIDIVIAKTESSVALNKRFLDSTGYNFKVLNANQSIFDDYKIDGTPTCVLLDKDTHVETTFIASTLSELEYATEIKE